MNRNHLSFGLNLFVAKCSRFDHAYFRIELLSIVPNQAVEFSFIVFINPSSQTFFNSDCLLDLSLETTD